MKFNIIGFILVAIAVAAAAFIMNDSKPTPRPKAAEPSSSDYSIDLNLK